MYFENEDELTLEMIEEILKDYRELLRSGLLEKVIEKEEEEDEGISWQKRSENGRILG